MLDFGAHGVRRAEESVGSRLKGQVRGSNRLRGSGKKRWAKANETRGFVS
jgi:hypothetical protein